MTPKLIAKILANKFGFVPGAGVTNAKKLLPKSF